MVRPVIVGVDGSKSGDLALGAAVREASLRAAPLRIVHSLTLPGVDPPVIPPPEALMEAAQQTAADAATTARTTEPGLEVTYEVPLGSPLVVLEEASREADLVVVGNRGRNAFAGLLLGSTSVQLAAHAHCPVMVTRENVGGRSTGPVVVGVDGSAANAGAVDFAFEAAAMRDSALLAVHSYTTWNTEVPIPDDPTQPYAAKPGALEDQEERLLAETLAGRTAKYPDVVVEPRSGRGPVRETLIEASRDAGLIVVGSRGRGGFTGMLLGSVSQAVLHHAHCPVVVVPHRT